MTATDQGVVFAIGTRLGDLTTQGYTFPESPFPQRKLIHVLADAKVLGVDLDISPWQDDGMITVKLKNYTPVPKQTSSVTN